MSKFSETRPVAMLSRTILALVVLVGVVLWVEWVGAKLARLEKLHNLPPCEVHPRLSIVRPWVKCP